MPGSAWNELLVAIVGATTGGVCAIVASLINIIGPSLLELLRHRFGTKRILLPEGVTVRPKWRVLISARRITVYLVVTLLCGVIAYVSSLQMGWTTRTLPTLSPTQPPSSFTVIPGNSPTVSQPTGTIIKTPQAGLTTSFELKATATFAPTATLNAYVSQGNCNAVPPPCTYTVRVNEYSIPIATKVYGNPALAVLIINFNRTPEGGIPSFRRGVELFIPIADPDLPLPYPICQQGGEFPCLFVALEGDTYAIVAQAMYGNVNAADDIREVNWIYDSNVGGLTQIAEPFREGTILILPVYR